jgi:alpha-beta hydrolase superfamily lysophospholipase
MIAVEGLSFPTMLDVSRSTAQAGEIVAQPPSKPSRLTELVVRVGLSSRVGSLAAEYLIARWLTKPACSRIGRTPSELSLAWEALTCATEDLHQLRGWLVAPRSPRATLLLFHGIRNNREQLLSRLAFLVPAGYRCVVLDHRAHGESEGRQISFGYHERLDVRAVLKLARERWPDQPLGVLGMSMGAAALCFLAPEVARQSRAIILESLYHDILTAFTNRMQSGHYPAYFGRLVRGVIRQCERRLGESAQVLTPADWVGALAPRPFMLVTGTEDEHSTPAEAQKLFARRQGPGELLFVPEAGHEDVCEVGGDLYRNTVLDFLDRNLFESRS